MFALISSTESVSCVTAWQGNTPIYTAIPNSYRVAQVCDAEFEVYQTLFFLICDDSVVADQYYYDAAIRQILPIPAPVEKPVLEQPASTGTQEL